MFCKHQNNAIMAMLSNCAKNKRDPYFSLLNVITNNGMKTAMMKYSSTTSFYSNNKEHLMNKGSTLFKNNHDIQRIRNNFAKEFATTSVSKTTHLTDEQMKSVAVEGSSKDISLFKNSNVLIFFNKNEPETIGQKIYRYLDITGFLTRYNNRKEWILDLDPYTRLSTVMLTEYERKLMIFLKFHVYLLFVICLYLWYHAQVHFTMKPPCPKPYAYGHLDGRKRDFTWHGRLFFLYPKMRCKDCRWLDVQCKKECFEKLKQEGHTFIINKGDPLSVPKTVLYPPHFH